MNLLYTVTFSTILTTILTSATLSYCLFKIHQFHSDVKKIHSNHEFTQSGVEVNRQLISSHNEQLEELKNKLQLIEKLIPVKNTEKKKLI